MSQSFPGRPRLPVLTACLSFGLVTLGNPVTAAPGLPLNAPGIVTHGPRSSNMVALTFDADMTPGMRAALERGAVSSYYNAAVVDVLRRTHTPATFFLAGLWAQVYPGPARALAADPLFQVENHSFDHPGFAQPCYGLARIEASAKAANLKRAQNAIRNVTGVTPTLMRFPGGCATAADVAVARSVGLTVVHWDVVGGDAGERDPRRIVRKTLDHVQGGSIVVLHASGGYAPATALALPDIIAGLKARGLEPVTLNTLLAPTP